MPRKFKGNKGFKKSVISIRDVADLDPTFAIIIVFSRKIIIIKYKRNPSCCT